MSEILHSVGFWKHPIHVINTNAEENPYKSASMETSTFPLLPTSGHFQIWTASLDAA